MGAFWRTSFGSFLGIRGPKQFSAMFTGFLELGVNRRTLAGPHTITLLATVKLKAPPFVLTRNFLAVFFKLFPAFAACYLHSWYYT